MDSCKSGFCDRGIVGSGMDQERRPTKEHKHIGERKKIKFLRYNEGEHEDDATKVELRKGRETLSPVQRPDMDVAR